MIEVQDESYLRAPVAGVRTIVEVSAPFFGISDEGDIAPMPDVEHLANENPGDDDEERYEEDPIFSLGGGPFGRHRLDEEPRYEPGITRVVSTYDTRGMLVERQTYASTQLTGRERFQYDAQQRLTKRTTKDLINETLEAEERIYDAQGRIQTITTHYGDGSKVTSEHTWSDSSEDVVTRSPDGVEEHFLRRYDTAGHITEVITFDPETGIRLSGEYYSYDSAGNLIESGVSMENGERAPIERSHYEEGHLVLVETLDDNGDITSEHRYAYENGLCITEEISTEEGEATIDNEYDDAGRLVHVLLTSETVHQEAIYAFYEEGMPEVTAERSVLRERRRSHATARTRWWSYEFYETPANQEAEKVAEVSA